MTKKTVDAGSLISASYADQLIAGYELLTDADAPSFIIKRELIDGILALPKVVGIRFIYGLKDALNPTSAEIILVPCTTKDEFGTPKPIISRDNYFNNKEESVTIRETAKAIRNYVNYIQMMDKNWSYQEVTRGTFFGINSLDSLLNKEGCTELKVTMGFGKQGEETRPHVHPVLEAQNVNHENSWLDILEDGSKCPPKCSFELAETLDILSGKQHSEDVNDLLMTFRNTEMLNSDNGKATYELYYFVTPLVSALLEEKGINNESFYNERFKPAIELITGGDNEGGMSLINEILVELVADFHYELV